MRPCTPQYTNGPGFCRNAPVSMVCRPISEDSNQSLTKQVYRLRLYTLIRPSSQGASPSDLRAARDLFVGFTVAETQCRIFTGLPFVFCQSIQFKVYRVQYNPSPRPSSRGGLPLRSSVSVGKAAGKKFFFSHRALPLYPGVFDLLLAFYDAICYTDNIESLATLQGGLS